MKEIEEQDCWRIIYQFRSMESRRYCIEYSYSRRSVGSMQVKKYLGLRHPSRSTLALHNKWQKNHSHSFRPARESGGSCLNPASLVGMSQVVSSVSIDAQLPQS